MIIKNKPQVTTLVRRRQPSLNTLNVLLEVEPFPGPDPESEHSCDIFVFVFAGSPTHLPFQSQMGTLSTEGQAPRADLGGSFSIDVISNIMINWLIDWEIL